MPRQENRSLMPRYYRIVLLVEIDVDADTLSDKDIAEHCVDASSSWGGQLHPDHPLFSTNVDVACIEYRRLRRRPVAFAPKNGDER